MSENSTPSGISFTTITRADAPNSLSLLLHDYQHTFKQDVEWLLTTVQVVDEATQDSVLKKMPQATAWIQNLFHTGIHSIQGTTRPTVKQLHDGVIKWLRESSLCLGTVRPGLLDTSRLYGFSTPGFDTHTAGAILPDTGEAITERDAVIIGMRRYIAEHFHRQPDREIIYRQFPYLYAGPAADERMRDAIFVQDNNGVWQYLTYDA